MIEVRYFSDSPFGSPAPMFRGKQAMNGEGQTGGDSPFNHLGVDAEEQNRTAKARRHGGRRSQDDERSMKMATKTTNIEVKVDETLAAAIAPRIALASRLGLTPSGDTTRRSRRGMRPATPTGGSGGM